MTVRLVVKSNNLPKIAARVPEAVDLAIDKFLSDVDANATADTPVDEGYLKNSKQREKRRIYWGANYAAYVNFGTIHMAAQPFASDAVAKCEPGFQAALRSLEGAIT